MKTAEVLPLVSEEDALAALEGGALLLTSNNRLAREYQRRYDRLWQKRGKAVWETPAIFPWALWLQSCYEQCLTSLDADGSAGALLLLNSFQEQSLWERVVSESSYREELLQIPSTARTAQEAWQLCHAWRLPLAEHAGLANEDTQAFLAWGKAFEAHCQVGQWLDSARLPDAVAALLPEMGAFLPSTVILTGFDEYTPQQQEFLVVLNEQGVALRVLTLSSIPGKVLLVGAVDGTEEISLAAQWARRRLEQSPGARIGIIIPQLESVSRQVARICDDVFHPEAILPGRQEVDRVYNISLAQPLGDYAVIYTALLVLRLAQGELPLAEMGVLLRSPFLGEAEQEFSCRALLDAHLRKAREATVSLGRLLAGAIAEPEEKSRYRCPALAERLRDFIAEAGQLPVWQPPSAWAKSFSSWLQVFGWPGERSLKSEEYQTVAAWHQAMEAFAGLDHVVSRLKYGAAIGKFQRLLTETPFQAERPVVPVQVLGILEAAGEKFDAAWIMGLHDGVWPSAPRPNPLLPIDLQRQYSLPRASAERELAYARLVTERLLASAPLVVVSYPGREGDSDLRPSPLIADLNSVFPTALDLTAVEPYALRIQPTGKREVLVDAQGPPLEKGTRVEGGTALLRDQAACPFRAFAKHRLGATGLEEPSLGLAALDQGLLLHEALQWLWEQLGDQQTLLRSAAEELKELATQAAKRAIAAQVAVRPQTFTSRFTAIEQERIEQLLLEWLEQDKQRAPFTVLHQEKSQPLSLGIISLLTRVDRIDQLESGEQVIIDYKTGQPKLEHWLGERPEEPQLPLYHIAHKEGKVAAVLFAQVRRGGMKYIGVAKKEGLIPNVTVRNGGTEASMSWEEQTSQWRQALGELAVEVQQGRATVAPKEAKSCHYCALPGLCRVYELTGGTLMRKKNRHDPF